MESTWASPDRQGSDEVNKRVAWISALTLALSVGLIGPALAVEAPAATAAPEAVAAVTQTVSSDVPVVTTDDFAPKTVPVVEAEKPAPVKAIAKKTTKRSTVRTAAVRKRVVRTVSKPKAKTASASRVSDQQTAESVLRSLKAKYRYLDGVTVTMGTTPGNYQAVSYYARGKIVISPKHTASISTILKHEIWHVIDYRDNGKIDWGERVAPKNAAEYLK